MNGERCPGCGSVLPEDVLCSVSHTIDPGAKLCSDCGQKESHDSLWAEGRRTGWARHNAAMDSMKHARKIIGDK